MRIRLTPLNIVSSALLIAAAYAIAFQEKQGGANLILLLLVLSIISFIADLIFRRSLFKLKRIWIVELVFLIFASVLMLILQRILP